VGILKTDAALTAEVLRRANSPVYGLSASVSSAGQAVMMLGTDEIRRLTLCISLGQHFGAVSVQCGGFGGMPLCGPWWPSGLPV
jgi:HD-like signal output (HDOD) protein